MSMISENLSWDSVLSEIDFRILFSERFVDVFLF